MPGVTSAFIQYERIRNFPFLVCIRAGGSTVSYEIRGSRKKEFYNGAVEKSKMREGMASFELIEELSRKFGKEVVANFNSLNYKTGMLSFDPDSGKGYAIYIGFPKSKG